MLARARAAPASTAPPARSDPPTASWVQSLRRKATIHMVDRASPGLALCAGRTVFSPATGC
eukprot:3294290-Alexandrium_andersonii.AAC.1